MNTGDAGAGPADAGRAEAERPGPVNTDTRPLLRIFVKGGVISPADLLCAMHASEAAGNDFVSFSSRQDILFPTEGSARHEAEAILEAGELEFVRTDLSRLGGPAQPRNIVSSYAAVNVLPTTWWLKEDVYHYVLSNFERPPKLKVHVVDPVQSLVPLFGGHLHFIASRLENYWHLHLRSNDLSERIERWPRLIHGDDLARTAETIESCLLETPDASMARILDEVGGEARSEPLPEDEREIELPNPFFPYYEGLNAMLNNHYWLGLYWRNNRFDIEFLRLACRLCQETRVGKISLTPWKSFIIKGIRAEDRVRWERLMGVFGINMRHSSLELNWHIPVMDAEALELKSSLVRELTLEDISTHGLTFTVKSPEPIPLFTSVVIEREPRDPSAPPRFTIRHARDFDPGRSEYVTYASGLSRSVLPERLIELTKDHSRHLGDSVADAGAPTSIESGAGGEGGPPGTHAPGGQDRSSYQCGDCLTVYDPEYGDPAASIDPDVPFDALPDDYRCPVCAAGKSRFTRLASA